MTTTSPGAARRGVRAAATAAAVAGLALALGAPAVSRAAGSGVTQPAPHWDSGRDFRGAPYSTNPQDDAYGNHGVWTYFWAPSTAGVPVRSTFIPMRTSSSAEGGVLGKDAWYGPDPSGPSHLPFVAYDATGSPVRIGPTLVDPPGTTVLHPSAARSAVLDWGSPWTGTACLRWTLADDDPGGGDGIAFHVLLRTRQIDSGSLPNGGLPRTGSRDGVPVQQGQHVTVVVDAGPAGGPGDDGFDSTAVQLHVAAC